MILLIDHEATSVQPETARILEIGAILCDFNYDILAEFSSLVWDDSYPELTQEVSKVTNITLDMLQKEGKPLRHALEDMALALAGYPISWVVAYNKKYDEVLYKAELERNLLRGIRKANEIYEAPWLCAMEDVETNYAIKCWRQSHLALEYGVAVDPKELHRAIGDVMLMRKILLAAKASAEGMYAFQKEPWTYLQAKVTEPWKDGGKGVAKAKSYGFSWEKVSSDPSGQVFPKSWVKRVKQRWVEKNLNILDMKVEVIV